MRRFIAIGLAFCATQTHAGDTFGNAAGCARAAGQSVNTDLIYFYDGDALSFHESVCRVASVLQVGSGAMLLTVNCSGEGDTWEAYYMLETTAKSDRLIIYPEASPDARTELQQCE